MMRYRKKAPEVEAFKYDGDLVKSDGHWYVPEWARVAYEQGVLFYKGNPPTQLYIAVNDGRELPVQIGDYVVRDSKGHIWPWLKEEFERYYEYYGV